MYICVRFPGGTVVKNLPANAGDAGDLVSISGLGRSPGRGASPIFLPGESQGQRSLAGYSPQSHKESDMTEHTHTVGERRPTGMYQMAPSRNLGTQQPLSISTLGFYFQFQENR